MVYRLFIIAFLLTGCASKPWTKEEKQLLGLSCLATVADMVTTFDGLDNGNEELNPIMGRHPSKEKVVVVLGLSQIATTIIAHYWESARMWLLGAKTGANAACTFHNLRTNH